MNPYHGRPDYTFWRRSISRLDGAAIDPVVGFPFRITSTDRIATAGSCFAQNIARQLSRRGFNYFVTEAAPLSAGAVDENYGLFSARYGNVYTTLQLLQLFDRAYGLTRPDDGVWVRADGAFIDPFRPQIQKPGFASEADLAADRKAHLVAARRVFEHCDVFVFTLGLTEAWLSNGDGMAVPLAPGVAEAVGRQGDYRFENLPVADMAAQLSEFIDKLRCVNERVRIILTVSPVSLIATYEERHVLVSTVYSKAALRVVAEMLCRSRDDIGYFPSYEIITGPHTRSCYLTPDLRDVTEEGVDRVMTLFFKHCVTGTAEEAPVALPAADPVSVGGVAEEAALMASLRVVCDEEAIERTAGAA